MSTPTPLDLVTAPQIAIACGASVVSLAIGWAVGALRIRSISGPLRLPPDRSPWTLVGAAALGFTVWIYTQVLFVRYWTGGSHAAPAAGQPQFTTHQTALLSALPGAIAAAILLMVDRFLEPTIIQRLGLSWRRAARGIPYGVLGILVVIGPFYLVNTLTQAVYQARHIQHPEAHDLLLAMNSASRLDLTLLVIGAVVVAPVFEELVFRGHIQTFTREFLIRRGRPGANAKAAASNTPQTVAAIIITSLLFTMIHPRWMWPPIFFLSLGLGFAYERTKNLWTSMCIHALFNGIETGAYLYLLFAKH